MSKNQIKIQKASLENSVMELAHTLKVSLVLRLFNVLLKRYHIGRVITINELLNWNLEE